MTRRQVFQQVRQGKTGVEDVLGHDDVTPFDLRREVFQDTHHAGALGAVSVRRDGHVVHFERKLDLARQIRHEDSGAAQNRDQDDALVGNVGVIARNGCAYLAYAIGELLFGEQDLRNVVVHVPNLYRRISLLLSPLINLRDQWARASRLP